MALIPVEILKGRSTEIEFSIFYKPSEDTKPYFIDGLFKVKKGVKHFYHWVERPQTTKSKAERLIKEKAFVFSRRPYKLGQGCDGTIGSCVLSLYFDFCQKHQFCPNELYRQAYSEREKNYFSKIEIREIDRSAHWQGTLYPKVWDEKAKKGLIESLTAIKQASKSFMI